MSWIDNVLRPTLHLSLMEVRFENCLVHNLPTELFVQSMYRGSHTFHRAELCPKRSFVHLLLSIVCIWCMYGELLSVISDTTLKFSEQRYVNRCAKSSCDASGHTNQQTNRQGVAFRLVHLSLIALNGVAMMWSDIDQILGFPQTIPGHIAGLLSWITYVYLNFKCFNEVCFTHSSSLCPSLPP